LGFDFRARVSSSCFFYLVNYWVLSLAGLGAGGSISSYISDKATQTSGICFEVKFCFGLCISKLKFRLRFVTIPDVCVAFASGGAGTSIPPRRKNYLVLFTRVKVMYLVTVLLSVLPVFYAR